MWLISLAIHFALDTAIDHASRIATRGTSTIFPYLAVTRAADDWMSSLAICGIYSLTRAASCMGCAPGDLARPNPEKQPVIKGLIGVAAIAVSPFLALALAMLDGVSQAIGLSDSESAAGPSALALGDIAHDYLVWYLNAARTTFGWRQDGPRVPLSLIQPGDLLFSAGGDGTPTNPGHVVMYLGGGLVI